MRQTQTGKIHQRPLQNPGDQYKPVESSRDRWKQVASIEGQQIPAETTVDHQRVVDTSTKQQRPLKLLKITGIY